MPQEYYPKPERMGLAYQNAMLKPPAEVASVVPISHRYLTDDRDLSRQERAELVVARGENGDYSLATVKEGDRWIENPVRICTSGGAASRNPRLVEAVRALFNALGGYGDTIPDGRAEATPFLPADDPRSVLYDAIVSDISALLRSPEEARAAVNRIGSAVTGFQSSPMGKRPFLERIEWFGKTADNSRHKWRCGVCRHTYSTVDIRPCPVCYPNWAEEWERQGFPTKDPDPIPDPRHCQFCNVTPTSYLSSHPGGPAWIISDDSTVFTCPDCSTLAVCKFCDASGPKGVIQIGGPSGWAKAGNVWACPVCGPREGIIHSERSELLPPAVCQFCNEPTVAGSNLCSICRDGAHCQNCGLTRSFKMRAVDTGDLLPWTIHNGKWLCPRIGCNRQEIATKGIQDDAR